MAVVLPLVLILSTTAPVSAEGEVAVTVNSPEEINTRDFLLCLVEIEEVTGLNAVQFDITYDPAILELNSIDDGIIGGGDLPVNFNEIETGHYRILVSLGLETIDGEGFLAKLTFYAVGAGTTPISLSGGLLSGMEGEIASEWIGSSVTVVSDEEDEGDAPADSQDEPEQPSQGDAPAGDGQTTGNQTSPGTEMDPAGEGEDEGAGTETEGDETTGGDEDTQTGNDGESSVTITVTGEHEIEITGEEGQGTTDAVENTASGEIKWPVIWGIIGFVIIIIGLVLYARLRKPLY